MVYMPKHLKSDKYIRGKYLEYALAEPMGKMSRQGKRAALEELNAVYNAGKKGYTINEVMDKIEQLVEKENEPSTQTSVDEFIVSYLTRMLLQNKAESVFGKRDSKRYDSFIEKFGEILAPIPEITGREFLGAIKKYLEITK